MKLAVIGGGWAGLAAAVAATRQGDAVTLIEMAPRLGGRARAVEVEGVALDNGQHILIGAYTQTLELLATIGVDARTAFVRTPLRLTRPDGIGLHLPPGAPVPAFVRAVWWHAAWSRTARIALLRAAAGWGLRRFRCDPRLTVAELTATLPRELRDELIDPLCVAALNTPAVDASAAVFLRVLQAALFSGPGSADLLLPRVDLSALLPEPAARWLAERSVSIALGRRVDRIERDGTRWAVDGERFDTVVVATSAAEAARLLRPIDAAWADTAAAMPYEPIVTVYAESRGTQLREPMLALAADAHAPAQFVFDRGQLGGPPGWLAFVISGARAWVERGSEATIEATIAQARQALGDQLRGPLRPLKLITEKRATFRCVPLLERPRLRVAPRLLAAADYIDGPFPATLEGAVRSGFAAASGSQQHVS